MDPLNVCKEKIIKWIQNKMKRQIYLCITFHDCTWDFERKSSWKKKKGENRKKLAKYSNKLLGTFIGIIHFKMKCGCNQFSHTPTHTHKKNSKL